MSLLKMSHSASDFVCNDTVASHDNIFLRRLKSKTSQMAVSDIRIFLHHDFRIYENKVGDTAFYDPENLALVHYKKDRYFLINTEPHFDSFSTGRKAFRDRKAPGAMPRTAISRAGQ